MICKECKADFTITDEDLKFYDQISPVFNSKKYQIPAPTLCPDCREQRRLTFRNDRCYYSRTCDLCKKSIVSLFHPDRAKNIYCNICWWSEKWDPLAYGRDYDFSRPFFEQFKEMWDAIPKITMVNDNGVQSVNCEYTSDFSFGKNAYMVLCSWHVEDCMYGFQTNWVKNSIDNLYLWGSELMYETVVSEKSYNCRYCQQVKGSSDCIFGYDLMNCKDCLLSAGLRNKQYCIWNKQYTKEEYFKQKEALNLGSTKAVEKLKEEFATFLLKIPRKFANLINCENTTGDNLKRCKDTQQCFNFSELHGCKFMTSGDKAVNCYDCNSTGNPELCYEAVTPDNGYMNIFMADCWNSKYLMYSSNCHNSQNLFGCIGLKKNQYCILNKQYSKAEYEELMPKIIEHMEKEWGEFFAPAVAPFSYDETAAQEWHPLNEEQAKKLGYGWIGEEIGSFGKETIQWTEVPDNIAEFQDNGDFSENKNILQEIFACSAPDENKKTCSKNYKINKQEFDFYKQKNIPLPHFCPNCRHKNRKQKLNPKKLWPRQCMCTLTNHEHPSQCQNTFETTFAPTRPESIYCEACYLKEIY